MALLHVQPSNTYLLFESFPSFHVVFYVTQPMICLSWSQLEIALHVVFMSRICMICLGIHCLSLEIALPVVT